jgi:hypothetical protein
LASQADSDGASTLFTPLAEDVLQQSFSSRFSAASQRLRSASPTMGRGEGGCQLQHENMAVVYYPGKGRQPTSGSCGAKVAQEPESENSPQDLNSSNATALTLTPVSASATTPWSADRDHRDSWVGLHSTMNDAEISTMLGGSVNGTPAPTMRFSTSGPSSPNSLKGSLMQESPCANLDGEAYSSTQPTKLDLFGAERACATETTTACDDLDIDRWCTAWELGDEVRRALYDQNFVSPSHIIHLGKEDLEILVKGLRLGEKAAFYHAVNQLRPRNEGASCDT